VPEHREAYRAAMFFQRRRHDPPWRGRRDEHEARNGRLGRYDLRDQAAKRMADQHGRRREVVDVPDDLRGQVFRTDAAEFLGIV
jgi:hypothetical protein